MFLLVFLLLYGGAYGIARWRKCVVMHERYVKEEGVKVRSVGPGHDVREGWGDWRGALKNRVNPAVFVVFWPLCLLEDVVRGGTRPIRRENNPHESARAGD